MPAEASLRRLTKRSQFLRAAKGQRAGRPSLSLQAVGVAEPSPGVGFTVTKKTGNAPQRSRIKRRLRAAVGACAIGFKPRHDYVLVGRREALSTPFSQLVSELTSSLARVHAGKGASNPAGGPRNERR